MPSAEQLAIDPDPRVLVGATTRVRDWEIVRWVGRLGAVTLAQLRLRFGLGRTVAYRRVAACVEGGLLERVYLLRGQPALIRATRRGLRLTGLSLGVAQAPPELVGHWISCGWVAIALEAEFGPDAVQSEREFRLAERWNERAIASAKLGENSDGSDHLHRPDLAVLREATVIAVEVELTPKSPKRLEAIVKAWRRARWVESVRYYTRSGPTQRGLERAIERMHASERIEVRPIEPLLGLATLNDAGHERNRA
ncbi:MAG: hypothetical protein GEU88_07550 [Solirubrobacterales bacterium]|nr:hypothetical protein [Solirubrobacterales bacterium]